MGEIIGGPHDRLADAQAVEVLGQKVELERVRVVVVDGGAVGFGQVCLRAVVVILLEQDASAAGQRVDDRLRIVLLPEPEPPRFQ